MEVHDHILREKMANLEIQAPEAVWEGISLHLKGARHKKRVLTYWRYAAGMAILIGIGGYLVNHSNQPASSQVAIQETELAQRGEVTSTYSSASPVTTIHATRTTPVLEPRTTSRENLNPVPNRDREKDILLVSTGPDTRVTDTLELATVAAIYQGLPGEEESTRLAVIDHTVQKDTVLVPTQVKEHPGLLLVEAIEQDQPKRQNTWSVGGQAAPLYSYRNLNAPEQAHVYKNYYDQSESGYMAYAGGVNVKMQASSRWSFQSGVYYSKIGQVVENVTPVAMGFQVLPSRDEQESLKSTFLVDNSSGVIIADNPARYELTNSTYRVSINSSGPSKPEMYKDATIIQQFEYLEVPFIARFKVIDRQVDLNILGGMSTNFLIGNSAILKNEDSREVIGKTQSINQVNYSSTIGLGLDYHLNKQLAFSVEPVFRYYLNPINKDKTLQSHPYSLGVFTGFFFSF